MKNNVIAIATGSRAEYGSLCLLIKKIIESKKLKLLLYVTGMHLLTKYGKSIDIIREDKIPIHRIIQMYPDQKEYCPDILGNSVGIAIQGFTDAFNKDKPDILLVSGDRFEIFSAVIAASTLNIAIGHIQGGDRVKYGQVDEYIRHSISKFAHLHFPGTESSAERLIKMGEEDWRIHSVGSPFIDQIYQMNLSTRNDIFKKFSLDINKKAILCLFHPFIPEAEKAGKQMGTILNTLKEIGIQTIILYSNNDPGSDKVIEMIEENRHVNYFKIHKNLSRFDYLSLLKNVDLFIGNSSSGCVESPTFKLPTIITGGRNVDRETAENVLRVPIEKDLIKKKIKEALSDKFKEKCKRVVSPYGDGKASERIVKILEDITIDEKFKLKILTY